MLKKPAVKWGLRVFLFIVAALQLSRLESFKQKPERAIDFRNIYIGSRLLNENKNPYTDSLIKNTWSLVRKEENLDKNLDPGLPSMGLLYPPLLLHLCRPFAFLGYTQSVLMIKIILFLNIFLMGWLLKRYSNLNGLKLWLPGVWFFLFALKPVVNMVNVGQLTPLFLSLFFGLLLLKDSQKWGYLVGSLFLFLKPTIGIVLAGNAIGRGKKHFLFFLLAGSISLSLLFFQGSAVFKGLLEQGRGQVAAAYDLEDPVYPYTFEAMSNTQLQSVCAIFGGSNVLCITMSITMLLLFITAAGLFFRAKNYKALEVFCVLASLIFTYHKYYDLLLLIPFAFYFLNNKDVLLKGIFCFLIIHLLLPYNLFKIAGLGNTMVNSLQFINSILPFVLTLTMAYGAFRTLLQNKVQQTLSR